MTKVRSCLTSEVNPKVFVQTLGFTSLFFVKRPLYFGRIRCVPTKSCGTKNL